MKKKGREKEREREREKKRERERKKEIRKSQNLSYSQIIFQDFENLQKFVYVILFK